METIRQGDVLLERSEETWGTVTTAGFDEPVVLARGETTGHVHAFDPRMDPVVLGFDRMGYKTTRQPAIVFVPKGGAMLRHGTPEKEYADGDHAPIHVPEGGWKVRVQREWQSDADLD